MSSAKKGGAVRGVSLLAFTAVLASAGAVRGFEFSRAGYWDAAGSPRRVASFNADWDFAFEGERAVRRVTLPHGIDDGSLGLEASGGVNRQGVARYVKRFDWRRTAARTFLHFEAVMGKCEIAVNGKVAVRHFGGYLPIHFETTELFTNGVNEVAVTCDNSDDGTYPPGKPQTELDFAYFGGIYRDAYLVETGPAYVTDSGEGGVHVRTRREGDGLWTVRADAVTGGGPGKVEVEYWYEGRKVGRTFRVEKPTEWTPDTPALHDLTVKVFCDGRLSDAVVVRFGFRDFTIGAEGLTLNGRPWRKLIGVNRHQDFAYLGNALANSLHWRDAKKFRDAGFTAIRNAHYPQDPAFMDACDALGLMVIVNTPGWQFWNDREPAFAARVYDDIRRMCRRDRSRASLLMWEPILNETRYPGDFARRARQIVREETESPNYCACDARSEGAAEYDVIYGRDFIREWGDFPDDWSAQNSPSRVAREWGETAMLVQADHYLNGHSGWASLTSILAAPPRLFGGCLWHGADHARGYHPDNFLGGVITYDRRRKYSWHMFKAHLTGEPYVFVANALEPYSPREVTIWSNCAYTASWYGKPFKAGDRISEEDRRAHEDAYFYEHRLPLEFVSLAVTRADGAKQVLPWARRFSGIALTLDTEGLEPVADGSDQVVAVASLIDEHGLVRHYQNEEVAFAVTGPAELVGPPRQRTRFGEATVILRLEARAVPEPITLVCRPTRAGAHVPHGAIYTFTPGKGDGVCRQLDGKTIDTRAVGEDQNAFRTR